MTMQATNPDLRLFLSRLMKRFMVLVPIIVGIIYQFLMFFFGYERIYVVLDPPGYIYPFVSLEGMWWITLTLLSSILCLLASANRIRPHRLVYPFYIYVVFLLIFVKPV